jgi:hypothetical protein
MPANPFLLTSVMQRLVTPFLPGSTLTIDSETWGFERVTLPQASCPPVFGYSFHESPFHLRMYQPSVTPGRPQNLLVWYPPEVHPKGRHKSVAAWEECDLGTGPVSSDASFSLVHVSLVDVCPYQGPHRCSLICKRDHQKHRIIFRLPYLKTISESF